MSIFLQILFVVLVITLFLVVYFNLRFVKYLQFKHPSVWEKLNKPSWVPSTSKADKALMKAFEDKEEYLALKDPGLNSLIAQRKKISFICMLVFCLYAGMFLAFVFKR
ncbi:MAG: hypothetical protein KGJ09_06680 [Candidatus Omnitrophica bacterium]|nr:hypothetical protein [Candidatus Omnitrophota bacterium]MDE2009749.1 hypothetical protein [Candidatus Omnitrophota bacterium]MDE2213854.1 hypothetical protein [Candidatus Omnitrophota bacterium]MDE2232444.1 hypothetical protein [Candidatus Omnitrophota bacterium]